MNGTFGFSLEHLLPGVRSVLGTQGIGPEAQVPPKIEALAREALKLFGELARPQAVASEISPSQFADVFRGEGQNEEGAPLEKIFPQADRLALYALTMGEGISDTIQELFRGKDYALGAMLDGVASLSADAASRACERMFRQERPDAGSDVLGYSPGYCGWHITAQRKLFDRLKPERIGIRINESCLMIPLKSVSGVLVDAPREAHIFEAAFSFCGVCRTFACRGRFERVLMEKET